MYYYYAEEVQLPFNEKMTTLITVTSKKHWEKEQSIQYEFSEEELDDLVTLEKIGIYEMAEGTYESEDSLENVKRKLKSTGKFTENIGLKNE